MPSQTIAIEFPLRGEWHSPTTPAKQVPSHGTHRMGLTYAFDFLQLDPSTNRPFRNSGVLGFLTRGIPLNHFLCWGKEIYAPLDGQIVYISDGIAERPVVHWLSESIRGIKTSSSFNEAKDDYSVLAGNYIVLKCSENIYMLFAHLQTNSISVSLNDTVKKGDFLARVGHSGNSTAPHLHFQVMDRMNIQTSRGVPCVFEQFEVSRNGDWETVYNQLPSDKDTFRYNK